MRVEARLRTLAARWALLAACTVSAGSAAALPEPPPAAELRGAPYAATATLVRNPAAPPPPGAADPAQGLALAARYADRIDVARIAAGRLGATADPVVLAAAVDARADEKLGAVAVTARAAHRELAVATAEAFAAAAAAYLEGTAGLALQPIGSTTVVERGWWHLPVTRPGRFALGAVAGLVAGCLLALVGRRREHRMLADRESFADAYGAPVLAEIPRLHGSVRVLGDIAVVQRPNGVVAEAYRGLRSAVLRPGDRPGAGLAHVVAVTSPRPGDGRSTVVANLAAALAEAGRSVLVVDADFGRPTAHAYLGGAAFPDDGDGRPSPGPGLAELLQSRNPGHEIAACLRPTTVPGVGLITAGQAGRLPAGVLLGMPAVIAEVRRCADVVLLDAQPVLRSQDAVDLLQHVETVVVTGRPGRTSVGQARRARFVIGRAGVRIAGVVLVGTRRDRDLAPSYATAAEPTAQPPAAGPATAPTRPPVAPPGLAGPSPTAS